MEEYKRKLLVYLVLSALILVIGIVYSVSSRKVVLIEGQSDNTLFECSAIASKMSEFPHFYVLGTKVDKCLYKIFEGESQFDFTVCNKKYGCKAGIGLGQLTDPAIKDCEKGLGKKIDPYNGQDNLECSLWLYKTYETAPWGCPECDWGSWNYWKEYCE